MFESCNAIIYGHLLPQGILTVIFRYRGHTSLLMQMKFAFNQTRSIFGVHPVVFFAY